MIDDDITIIAEVLKNGHYTYHINTNFIAWRIFTTDPDPHIPCKYKNMEYCGSFKMGKLLYPLREYKGKIYIKSNTGALYLFVDIINIVYEGDNKSTAILKPILEEINGIPNIQ